MGYRLIVQACSVFSMLMGACGTNSSSIRAFAQEFASPEAATSLPLPQHLDRIPEPQELTRPKESQPNRESKPSVFVKSQRAMPIPGRPGRNLAPLGQLETDSPEASTESETSDTSDSNSQSAADESLGLIGFLPHQIRKGGITFEYIYTGETFTKAHGGITPGHPTNYRSNFDMVGILDTQKMGWWDNGRLFVYGQNLSGRPLSAEEVGDIQLFSNLDSTISETERPHFTTIAEYWYEHLCLDGALRFKIGKQDANVDFFYTDLGGHFVHSSFGFPPMIPFPTFPSQALGAAFFLNLTDKLVFGFGAYDGTLPSGPQGVRWGFDTLGNHGAITLYQLEWKPEFGSEGQFPSTIRTGMWHHSDKDVWTQLTSNPDPVTYAQNYGFSTSIDQMIWKEEGGPDNDQGLGVFGQFGWAPGNRNVLQEYYGAGLVYKGLLPDRDHDYLGFGFGNALFGSGFREQSEAEGLILSRHETAYELFYRYQSSPFVSFQPDLQYIANPSGQYKDALVVGLRFEVVL